MKHTLKHKKGRRKYNQIGTAYADKPQGEEGETPEWEEEDDAYDDEQTGCW